MTKKSKREKDILFLGKAIRGKGVYPPFRYTYTC